MASSYTRTGRSSRTGRKDLLLLKQDKEAGLLRLGGGHHQAVHSQSPGVVGMALNPVSDHLMDAGEIQPFPKVLVGHRLVGGGFARVTPFRRSSNTNVGDGIAGTFYSVVDSADGPASASPCGSSAQEKKAAATRPLGGKTAGLVTTQAGWLPPATGSGPVRKTVPHKVAGAAGSGPLGLAAR